MKVLRVLTSGVLSLFIVPIVTTAQWIPGSNAISYLGNVGIGTASPDGKLHVNAPPAGTSLVLGDATNSTLFVRHTHGTLPNPIVFAGSGTSSFVFDAGSADRMVIRNNGDVGIGTAIPMSKFDLKGGNLRLSRPGDPNGYVFQNYGSGTALNIGYMTTDDTNWFGGAPAMTLLVTGNVGIGTTNPQYKLAVNGTIAAKDVIVTNTGWSDYVFKPGYRLQPLSEVSAFIQKHQHLPDIPSEAEVNAKGVSVGEMQAKLLAKVEELTLHMIQQEKENRELREHMNQQQTENRELRERLTRLEKTAPPDSTLAEGK